MRPGITDEERAFTTRVGRGRYERWKDSPSYHASVDKLATEIQAAIGEVLFRRAVGLPRPSYAEMVASGKGPDALHYNIKTYVNPEHVLFVHPPGDATQSFTAYLVMLWLDPETYIFGEIEKRDAVAPLAFWNTKVPTHCWSVRLPDLNEYTGPLALPPELPEAPALVALPVSHDRGCVEDCLVPGTQLRCKLCRWSPTYWRR